MDRAYWRSLFATFPYALMRSVKQYRLKGLWLAVCVFVFKRLWLPMQMGPVIRLTNWREAANYMDNFILGELRHAGLEKMLHELKAPAAVVEVGVNVGITTRWWLDQNPALQVIGVDMMQEALDYTTHSLQELNLASRWHPVAGAVGDAAGQMEVVFDDPLEGTNSLDNGLGGQRRQVEINTLDAYLARAPEMRPVLLKLDIEGHAAAALRGAGRLLVNVPWVVVETHHEDELTQCASLLTRAGFTLCHFHGRTMWWRREVAPQA